MFRYIPVDIVLSLNNSKFAGFVDRINPIELDINATTDTAIFMQHLHMQYTSLS
jgi:hypothetical protein